MNTRAPVRKGNRFAVGTPRGNMAALCLTTGITYRQLDYWIRTGRLGKPKWPGSGGARRLDADEVLRVFVIAALAGAGLPQNLDISTLTMGDTGEVLALGEGLVRSTIDLPKIADLVREFFQDAEATG